MKIDHMRLLQVFSRYSFLAFAFWLITCSPKGYPIKEPGQGIAMDIITLSSDHMEGREIGTEGADKAAEYIEKRFKEIGLNPKGDNNTYFQVFSRKKSNNPHGDDSQGEGDIISGKNVVGWIDNKAPFTVVIGAHYDHLGYGKEGSLYTGPAAIHNGADDNASGVSGVLYLAESIKKAGFTKYNYLFVSFSGEEKGLWGSNYFVKNCPVPANSIHYMINMDMIGRLNAEKKLSVGGVGTSPAFDKIIDQNAPSTLSIKKELSGMAPSDHASFYNADVPVLGFFTGQHEDYHKPSDDHPLINYKGAHTVLEYIFTLVRALDSEPKLSFTKTKDETQNRVAFNVTMGVMPDYLYDGKGMKIDGVKEGRPAFGAGLMKGDIIIKMGEIDVADIQTYMKCLSTYQQGQTVEVTILREGKEVKKPVTF